MKKSISLLLALAQVFGLCACTGNTPESADPSPDSNTLSVGFGRENINPTSPVGMGGYNDSESRKSGAILDPIYTTCLAFRAGEETILIYTIDTVGMWSSSFSRLREQVSKATGVPQDNIFVGATHTHSAPSAGQDNAYDTMFYNAATYAAESAIKDLAPAQLLTASTELKGMNFVRHYLMNDGTYYGPSFGSTASGIKEHAMEPDSQMQLIKIERENKKDILMVNWQGHPASAANTTDYTGVSSDFVGHLRSKVENETDMLVAYFTGASGNVVRDSKIESIGHGLDYIAYGKKLGEFVIETLSDLKPVNSSGIATTRLNYDAEIDHSWDHMINEANEVFDLWKSTDKATGDALAKQYNFTSVYQAKSIINRYKMPATEQMDLRAFRVGGIGFTTGTYEMFCDHGLYVKQNSPFETTFIICGCYIYIPNEASFGYRSYEADCGFYAKGTGEKLAEKYVELLNAVK